MTNPLDTRPKTVTIIAPGPSLVAYAPMLLESKLYSDEVWARKVIILAYLYENDNLSHVVKVLNKLGKELFQLRLHARRQARRPAL